MSASMNFETRLFNCADLQSILDCVLDGGLELTAANLGNVKLVDQRQGYLTIGAQRGFHQEFLDFSTGQTPTIASRYVVGR